MTERRILLGVVGRPHGVRGLVRLHSYTADPADLAAYGPLQDEQGRDWTAVWRGEGVAELRDASGRAVADRTAAARLVNMRLLIERSRLPPVDREEFYLVDLVGLLATSPDGQELGRVETVHDYGAGVSLEIGRLLVPFTRACVPGVDVAAGRIVVVLPDEVEVGNAPSPAEEERRGEGSHTHNPAAVCRGQPSPDPTLKGALTGKGTDVFASDRR